MTISPSDGCGFTPGPWEYCSCGCGFIGGGDDQVATITIGKWGDYGTDFITGERSLVHHWGTVPPERAQANARLIAAAPDYDSAAAEIVRQYELNDCDKRSDDGALEISIRDLRALRAAFLKGRGE